MLDGIDHINNEDGYFMHEVWECFYADEIFILLVDSDS